MKILIINSPTYGDKQVYIDDEDFELVSNPKYTWRLQKDGKTFYAHSNWIKGVGRKLAVMHRLIMNVSDREQQIDHIDRNGLNNQKSNLRICNLYGNAKNRGPQDHTYSGLKGVVWSSPNRFSAKILVNGKRIGLGTFKTKEEAAIAYNEAAKKYYGEYAYLNPMDK